MPRLLATIILNNSGLIFKYVKVMNVFTSGGKFGKSTVVVNISN